MFSNTLNLYFFLNERFRKIVIFWLLFFFNKLKLRLFDLDAVCMSVHSSYQLWMPEPIFVKLPMYIMALEPISTAHFITPPPPNQSVCLYVYLPIVAREFLGIKSYHGSECTRNNRRFVGLVFFYAVCVVSKISMRLFLSITSCIYLNDCVFGQQTRRPILNWEIISISWMLNVLINANCYTSSTINLFLWAAFLIPISHVPQFLTLASGRTFCLCTRNWLALHRRVRNAT
jgi:hypothetical protein